MGQQHLETGGMINLSWSGDLTIRHIAELKVQIEEALEGAAEISITLAADAEGDMALLQLLCAAHRTALQQGKTLTLAGEIPAQLKMIMNLAGFSRHIGCSRDQAESCLWKVIHQQCVTADVRPISPGREFSMRGSDL